MTMTASARLSLGPLLYYWPRQQILDFYDEMASAPVDIVYLGETVCARRHELELDDWIGIGQRLREAGKEVVFSSQVLLESESDVRRLKALLAVSSGLEANDMTAVNLVQRADGGFVAGMTLNLYNEDSLALMARWARGAGWRRWNWMPTSWACWRSRWRGEWKPRSSPSAACRWPIPRAASPPAISTGKRTAASLSAATTRTGWKCARRMTNPFWC
jgi:hypothetical protein